ncbi:hypothetical protein ACMAZE_16730 [Pseudopelagicola sp. nBUS_20]|uniref:hypothetical protein n=1 Tax=Pseudopelagicola sp. nBUS_20 TaxID=3395317 RepID=UPI003EBA8404
MKRFLQIWWALVFLTACEPQIPDSAANVGFGNAVNSAEARAQRDAELSGRTTLTPLQSVSVETIPEAPEVAVSTNDSGAPLATTATARPPAATSQGAASPTEATDVSDLARETRVALDAANSNSGNSPLQASPSNPAPALLSNPGISDENDFDAVGQRRSIEEDAAQRERNKANYKVIEPTEIPKRSGQSGSNIVAYALSTNNPKGSRAYQRMGLTSAARHERNCAKFSRADQAQAAFLSRGGPKVDRFGLDPDGDGYACAWDPAPFRKAAKN